MNTNNKRSTIHSSDEVFGKILFKKTVKVPRTFTVEDDIIPLVVPASPKDLVFDSEKEYFFYPASAGLKYFPTSWNVFESPWNFLPIRHGGFAAKIQITTVHRFGFTNKEIVDMSGQYFGTDDPELDPVSEIFNEYALGIVHTMMREDPACLDAYRKNGPCRILIPTFQNPQRCSRNAYHHPFITLQWDDVYLSETEQDELYSYYKETIPNLNREIKLCGWHYGFMQGGFFWDPKEHDDPPADFHMFVVS